MTDTFRVLCSATFLLLLASCSEHSPDGEADVDAGVEVVDAGEQCGPDLSAPDEVLTDTTDPEQGDFTLEEALVGLPEGPGPLRAILDTDLGALSCELRP